MLLATQAEGGWRRLPPIRVHGQTVRLFARSRDSERGRGRFPNTKNHAMVVDPRSMKLEGTFFDQARVVLETVRMSVERVLELDLLFKHIQEALATIWPGCQTVPFGSLAAGLALTNSDADCFVVVPEPHCRADSQLVNKAQRALRKYPHYFTETLAIPAASTPIVKLFHLPTAINCDLSFKNSLGVENSHLLCILMQVNNVVRPCMVLLKYWARVRQITGPSRLSNYALVLMFVAYLQVHTELIPSIESLQQRDPTCLFEEAGWKVGFCLPEQLTADLPLHMLMGGFFAYYAEFEYERLVISPFAGAPLEKSLFEREEELRARLPLYCARLAAGEVAPLKHDRPVALQDPYSHSHNVTSGVSPPALRRMKEEFAYAAAAYVADYHNNYANFLRHILLNGPPRPKVARARAALSISYGPAQRSMVPAEWRRAMLDATRIVLGDMLRLRLDEVAGRPARVPHKHQHIHAWETLLDKPIWKRKRFNAHYARMNYDFIETQTRITDEIIAVHREELFLRMAFQLRLKGTATNPSATLTVRYIDGDLHAFLEMKGFFAGRLRGWVRAVLKIHLRVGDLAEEYLDGEAIAANRRTEEERAARGSPPHSEDSSDPDHSDCQSECDADSTCDTA